MDRRDPMALSGSASYFTSRGITGSGTLSGLHGSPGIHPLSNPNMAFQSNIGGTNVGSTLPVEPSSAISYHGVNVGAPAVAPPGESLKRKRGRPRKYGPDGTVSLALSPAASANPGTVSSSPKRGRGRPPGSGKKQQLASLGGLLSGSAGIGFTPHIISIAVGEDVATKIMAFSQQGPRAVCVLSANGAVSTVTLRQPSTSGGTVTYEVLEPLRFKCSCIFGVNMLIAMRNEVMPENRAQLVSSTSEPSHEWLVDACRLSEANAKGILIYVSHRKIQLRKYRLQKKSTCVVFVGRFEIICLSGSYLLTEIGSSRNRSGGLSVSLASPDGRVIGGGVGGMLIAATPVQVILGSFTWGGSKTKNKKKEAVEGVTDLEHETIDNSVALNSIQPDQSLSQGASLAAWQASQPLDMHNSHVDIDLMRG